MAWAWRGVEGEDGVEVGGYGGLCDIREEEVIM